MFEIKKVNYNDPHQTDALMYLLNEYALDEMGGAEALSDFCKANLIDQLKQNPNATSFILYDEQKAIGFSNCFMGFSTFACQPLLNIHDFAIIGDYRGKKLSQLLLGKIETFAKSKGCCKVTLEVLANNIGAKKAYENYGFKGYELIQNAGVAEFWQKYL